MPICRVCDIEHDDYSEFNTCDACNEDSDVYASLGITVDICYSCLNHCKTCDMYLCDLCYIPYLTCENPECKNTKTKRLCSRDNPDPQKIITKHPKIAPDSYFCEECVVKPPESLYTQAKYARPMEYVIDSHDQEHQNKKPRFMYKDEFDGEYKFQGPTCFVDGVINILFSFMSDRDKLLNVSLVCKYYREILKSDKRLWMNGDGQSLVQKTDNMLFVYNVPTRPITFPIRSVGISLKMLQYLLYDKNAKDMTNNERIVLYWPRSLDSLRCMYTLFVSKWLFGENWPWKNVYTNFIVAKDRESVLYEEALEEEVHDVKKYLKRLLVFEDLSPFLVPLA